MIADNFGYIFLGILILLGICAIVWTIFSWTGPPEQTVSYRDKPKEPYTHCITCGTKLKVTEHIVSYDEITGKPIIRYEYQCSESEKLRWWQHKHQLYRYTTVGAVVI